MIGINNVPRNTVPTQRGQVISGNKVTRYDIINKNYIFPQEKINIQSSYNAYYYDNTKDRVRTEKASYPVNEILPTGKFQANSSYIQDYVNTQPVRRHLIKHQGQLKIGGKFEGQSSYLQSYSNQGSFIRQEKVTFPQNKIMPQGNFQAVSTYSQNYQNNPSQYVTKVKPVDELKLAGGALQGQSTYLTDYNNKEVAVRSQKIKLPENQILPQGQFEGSSTYGETYLNKQLEKKIEMFRHQGELKIGGQFYGESGYAQNYFDKGLPIRKQKLQIKNNLVIPQGKFQEDTTYASNYLKTTIPRVEKFKPEGELKLVGGPLQGQSSYESEYVKKEIGLKSDRQKIVYPQNEVIPKGKFVGSSTYQNTYLGTSTERNTQMRPQNNLNIQNKKFVGSSSYEIDFESRLEGPRYLNKQSDYLSLKK